MDAVSDHLEWDVALYKDENKILGIWPFLRKKKWGVRILTQPSLTPYLGPWIITPRDINKKTTLRKFNRKVLKGLTQELPKAIWILCHAHYSFINWQPLSWMGFGQTTRYTFTLDLGQSEEILLTEMSAKTRNKIVSAQKKIEIRPSNDMELMYQLIENSFDRQKLAVPFTHSLFKRLDAVLSQKNARKMWIAYAGHNPVAGVYITYDHHSAYLMLTGRTSEDPGGSVGLLIWTAIRESKKLGREVFDFEGSMIEQIAFFFESFGGDQRPYHRLYRTANKPVLLLLKALNRL